MPTAMNSDRRDKTARSGHEPPRAAVSLKTLSRMMDAHRSSVRRWLRQAGIQPIALSDAKNGAIRYRWVEIERWLATREPVD